MSNPRKIRDYDLEKIKTVPKNSIFRLIFSRICISALLIILQVVVLAAVTFSWSERHTKEVILLFMVLASAGIFIVILNSESNPTYKISWIIPVALLPFFGSMLYLLSHYNIGSIASTKAVRQSLEDTEKYSRTAPEVRDALRAQKPEGLRAVSIHRKRRRLCILPQHLRKVFSAGRRRFPGDRETARKGGIFYFSRIFHHS